MTTTARLMTLNCYRLRLKPPLWTKRRGPLVDVINDARPSILGLQECDDTQLAYIADHLAGPWDHYDNHNQPLLWRADKWRVVPFPNGRPGVFHLDMQGGGRKRYATIVHLESRKTRGRWAVVNTHLSVHEPSAGAWRLRQIRTIDRFLDQLGMSGRVKVIMGDLNSTSLTAGVRGEAARLGYQHLRSRCQPGTILRAGYPTHVGFNRRVSPVASGPAEWLDDILSCNHVQPATTTKARPYAAKVVLTDNTTDHNGLLARLSF